MFLLCVLIFGQVKISHADNTMGTKAAETVSVGSFSEIQDAISQETEVSVQLTKNISFTSYMIIGSDKKVTIDLNGYNLEGNFGTKNDVPFFAVEGELTICDTKKSGDDRSSVKYDVTTVNGTNKPVKEERIYTGGIITGANKSAMEVKENGVLNLDGVCMSGNGTLEDGYDAGAIAAMGKAKINLNGAIITNNKGSWGGAIRANDSSEININKDTVIANNEAVKRGGGVYASSTAKVTLNGGYVTNNVANAQPEKPSTSDGGAGIRLDGLAKFVMTDGYVTGNESLIGGGAGIRCGFYDKNDKVDIQISGGYISGNQSHSEGAGMSVGAGGKAVIDGNVYITYNEVNDTPHWGGGGLFCADGGVLQIKNLLVKNNQADGYGGGVAGCSTGRVFDFNNAAAIFDNKASGKNLSGSVSAKSEDNQYTLGNDTFLNAGYQDYFCALNSSITNGMLGGGLENWTGSADNQVVKAEGDDTLEASFLMGLTANPSNSDKDNALRSSSVIVENNYSYTHGGGILCNGYLILGDMPTSLSIGNRLHISALKGVVGKTHTNGLFEFNLLDDNYKKLYSISSVTTIKDENKGDVETVIPFQTDDTEGETRTYYLVEAENGSEVQYKFDGAVYQIVLEGHKDTDSIVDIPVSTSIIDKVSVAKGIMKDGKFVANTEDYTDYTANLSLGTNHAQTLVLGDTGEEKDGIMDQDAFVNTLRVGSLKIQKTSIGKQTPDDTTFTITGPNGYEKTITYSEFKENAYVLNDLELGSYKIVEAKNEIEGYTVKVEGNQSTVEVKENETKEVVLTNTYTPVVTEENKTESETTATTETASTTATTAVTTEMQDDEKNESSSKDTSASNSNSNHNVKTNHTTNNNTTTSSTAETGDQADMVLYVLLGIICASFIIAGVIRRKK